jgi:peroxiredoxin
MRRQLLTAALALLAMAAHAQSYTVKATLKGLPDGTVVELVPMSHDNEKAVATGTIQGGTVTFTGRQDDPRLVWLRVKDTYGFGKFMLDNSTIAYSADVTPDGKNQGVDVYRFANARVTGSPLTDEYLKMYSVRDTLDGIYQANDKKFADVRNKYFAAKTTDEKKAVEGSAEYKAMLEADKQFFALVETKLDSTIRAHRDTFWGPLLMLDFMNYFRPEEKTLYEAMSPAAKASWYGKKVYAELFPAGGVGADIKPFTIVDEAGKSHTLASLVKGKKVALIDFWASWCAPCRKEIPNVKAQYAKYKDKGFQVISISTDRDAKAWKKACTDEKLQWPSFLDTGGKVADQYQVRAIPAMYLFDVATGKILATDMDARGEKLAQKLAEVLK